jgi:hypothetical protein
MYMTRTPLYTCTRKKVEDFFNDVHTDGIVEEIFNFLSHGACIRTQHRVHSFHRQRINEVETENDHMSSMHLSSNHIAAMVGSAAHGLDMDDDSMEYVCAALASANAAACTERYRVHYPPVIVELDLVLSYKAEPVGAEQLHKLCKCFLYQLNNLNEITEAITLVADIMKVTAAKRLDFDRYADAQWTI